MPLNYASSRETALQQYQAAIHLLTVTYPLVKDPKLLVGVLQNIFASLESSMTAILAYDQQLHLVPQELPLAFKSKYDAFRLKSSRRYAIPGAIVYLIGSLQEVLDLHRVSPMEFQRGNRFVICTKEYQMKVISITDIRGYLEQAEAFLKLMEEITKQAR